MKIINREVGTGEGDSVVFRLERQLEGSPGEAEESMRAVGQRHQWKKESPGTLV